MTAYDAAAQAYRDAKQDGAAHRTALIAAVEAARAHEDAVTADEQEQ